MYNAEMKEQQVSRLSIRQLRPDDGTEIFNMLQYIGRDENEFTNEVNGMQYADYKEWLKKQDNWAHGIGLCDGYVVQTTYWLFNGDIPIGYGKIRDELTAQSRIRGGNIGYAIASPYRGQGYGTYLMKSLIETAKKKGIKERLATVQKFNYPSKTVIEKCGGKLIRETDERWYFEL